MTPCACSCLSLVATNACRYRLAAGKDAQLLEFGLRRAQGPDGSMTASRYCYLGGFDATSNCKASQLFDIPLRGTHAHSFVCTFKSMDELQIRELAHAETGVSSDFVAVVLKHAETLGQTVFKGQTNEGELAAFTGYALAFPRNSMCLVDTYNTLKSGVPNFCAVAMALLDFGYMPLGVRLDSGDLAYLSKQTRKIFHEVAEKTGYQKFLDMKICASNEINEQTLLSLNQQSHQVDIFGIGTHLVTCQNQTALGCVYKLVSVGGVPRMKLAQEMSKVSIPARKDIYRLKDAQG